MSVTITQNGVTLRFGVKLKGVPGKTEVETLEEVKACLAHYFQSQGSVEKAHDYYKSIGACPLCKDVGRGAR